MRRERERERWKNRRIEGRINALVVHSLHALRVKRHLRQISLSVSAIKATIDDTAILSPPENAIDTRNRQKLERKREKFHTEIAFSLIPKSSACCEFNHHLIFCSASHSACHLFSCHFLPEKRTSSRKESRKCDIKLTSRSLFHGKDASSQWMERKKRSDRSKDRWY